MRRFRKRNSSSGKSNNRLQETAISASNALVTVSANHQPSDDQDEAEMLGDNFARNVSVSDFSRIQSHRLYAPIFDNTVTQAGEAKLADFPRIPPPSLPNVIEISDEKKNHITMNYGFVQYNFRDGLKKGETSNCYGDDFCQVHGINRVLVVDCANHLIAMCTPHRYMCYMANQMYVPERLRFNGNIFEFGGAVVATPRWAMRAAAWNILVGQGGNISKVGDTISISGSNMIGGIAKPAEMLTRDVPFSGASWLVMYLWLEQARAHKISIVAADTGLTKIVGRFDSDKTFPIVIREDETDMLMCNPVRGLVIEDDRFHTLRERGEITKDTKALLFRNGWYAPFSPSGITRIMRLLKFDNDPNGFMAHDGSGPWKKPEKAYSNEFVHPASNDLWLIGGVEDVHDEAAAKRVGTHLEMDIHLAEGSGGLN